MGSNVRLTEAELSVQCDAALQSSQEWLRLKAELEALPRMEAQLVDLCDSIGRVSGKFERLQQSLSVCLSNRELHLGQLFTQKKTSQLERQRAQHTKATTELRTQLEAATRAAAASYRQATSVDPPLLHPQPLPNAAVTTAYGSAQLGNVTAEVRPIQITKFKKSKPSQGQAAMEQKVNPTSAAPTQSTAITSADELKSADAAVGAVVVPAAGAGLEAVLEGDAGEAQPLLSGGG